MTPRRSLLIRILFVIATIAILASGLITTTADPAAADGDRGPYGVVNLQVQQNASQAGFLHNWNGGWWTNYGLAWCIDTGWRNPRFDNAGIGDVPAARGATEQQRLAMSYAMWAYAGRADHNIAAALSIVLRGLSHDTYSSAYIPEMVVNNGTVKILMDQIYWDAMNRYYWAEGPWQTSISLNHVGGASGRRWEGVATYKNVYGNPIRGAEVWIAANGVTQSPGVGFPYTTDANGQVHLTYEQAPNASKITVYTEALAPSYYRTIQGAPYAGGPAQRLIIPTETKYTAEAEGKIAQGFGLVRKTTTNPNYQSAQGVTFDVRPVGGGASLGTLTVGATGTTNTLALDPGTYEAVETSVPAGLVLDPTPHVFTVTAFQTTTFDLVNDVRREARLDLIKLDADTGEPVAGAVIQISRDSDNNGTYDEDLGTHTLDVDPLTIDGLSAGKYEITEVEPPPGYALSANPTQHVTLEWNSTTEVVFTNRVTPSISTYSQANGDDSTDGDITVPYGTRFHDVAVVDGLAVDEQATVEVALYGPFASPDDLACDPTTVFGTGSYVITGSGHHPSPTFSVITPGIYTFIETLVTEDRGEYSGECGDEGEWVTVETPAITTVAQAQGFGSTASVVDVITVTGVAIDYESVLTATLYGPFATTEAITAACAVGDLGPSAGSVTNTFTGPGEHTSSSIAVTGPGWFTFEATMVLGDDSIVSHACGDPAETFYNRPTPSISTYSQASGDDSTDGDITVPYGTRFHDVAVVDGLAVDERATVEVALYGPFATPDDLACDPSTVFGTGSYVITGSGHHPSPTFSVITPGIYTFIETLVTEDRGEYSGECGDEGEWVTVETPAITTVAQAQGFGSTASVVDVITVTGVATDYESVLTATLYGPFASTAAITAACAVGDLGPSAGSVTNTFTGPGEHTSSSIAVTGPGWFTFATTMVLGDDSIVSHACGDPAETFYNRPTPSISTYSQASGDDSTDGDITVPYGTRFHDVAVVDGLAVDERATVEVALYGPFATPDDLVCDPTTVFGSGSYVITGSGHHPSPTFSVTSPGIYTFVETLVTEDRGEYSGECGDAGEWVTVETPAITTVAQASGFGSNASVVDVITVTGVATDYESVLTATLYGPFATPEAIAAACAADDLGPSAGSVTNTFTGPGEHTSSSIAVTGPGWFTFTVTMVLGDDSIVSHACGDPAETFYNRPTPSISTYSQANGDDSTDGDITIPYGTRFHDVAVVDGLSDTEQATVEVALYGPFASPDDLVCDPTTVFGSGSYVITGSGHHPSPTFSVITPGIYTFIETLVPEDRGEYSGECGDEGEWVTVETPAITTVAQAQGFGSTASVVDVITVTGVATDYESVLTATLYGPFASTAAITAACAVGDLGPAVGSVTNTFTGPGEHTSSSIAVTEPGWFTFEVTMVLGDDSIVSHACGDPAETFHNRPTPSISTYSQANGDDSTDGDITVPYGTRFHDVAVVDGLAVDEEATVDVTLYGPFATRDDLTCDPTTAFGSGSYTITGSGHHPSPTFAVTSPGIYTFIETLVTEDRGEYSGECGDAGEWVTVETPAITTVAQVTDVGPGAEVTDRIFVTGVADGVEGKITTTLYGPFKDNAALVEACAMGTLSHPVGSVVDSSIGSGELLSSAITLPAENYEGTYTFIATLTLEDAEPYNHECGAVQETFVVTNDDLPSDSGKISRPLPRTGAAIGTLAAIGVMAVIAGVLTTLAAARRRRSLAASQMRNAA